jgi:large conductance mechanosensitive channel
VFKDFRQFILRGNVVDLAVGVVIGAAFGAVVTSFVKNLLTPLIAVPGKASFDTLHFTIRTSTFKYGLFINDLVSFVLIAAAVFFFVVRPVNALMARLRPEAAVDVTTRSCPECLSDIPKAATKCAFCTTKVTAMA